jgi:hypothetical protein
MRKIGTWSTPDNAARSDKAFQVASVGPNTVVRSQDRITVPEETTIEAYQKVKLIVHNASPSRRKSGGVSHKTPISV